VVGARVQSSFARAQVQLTGSDASRDSLRSEFGAPGYLDKRQQGGVLILRCGRYRTIEVFVSVVRAQWRGRRLRRVQRSFIFGKGYYIKQNVLAFESSADT